MLEAEGKRMMNTSGYGNLSENIYHVLFRSVLPVVSVSVSVSVAPLYGILRDECLLSLLFSRFYTVYDVK